MRRHYLIIHIDREPGINENIQYWNYQIEKYFLLFWVAGDLAQFPSPFVEFLSNPKAFTELPSVSMLKIWIMADALNKSISLKKKVKSDNDKNTNEHQCFSLACIRPLCLCSRKFYARYLYLFCWQGDYLLLKVII